MLEAAVIEELDKGVFRLILFYLVGRIAPVLKWRQKRRATAGGQHTVTTAIKKWAPTFL